MSWIKLHPIEHLLSLLQWLLDPLRTGTGLDSGSWSKFLVLGGRGHRNCLARGSSCHCELFSSPKIKVMSMPTVLPRGNPAGAKSDHHVAGRMPSSPKSIPVDGGEDCGSCCAPIDPKWQQLSKGGHISNATPANASGCFFINAKSSSKSIPSRVVDFAKSGRKIPVDHISRVCASEKCIAEAKQRIPCPEHAHVILFRPCPNSGPPVLIPGVFVIPLCGHCNRPNSTPKPSWDHSLAGKAAFEFGICKENTECIRVHKNQEFAILNETECNMTGLFSKKRAAVEKLSTSTFKGAKLPNWGITPRDSKFY